MNYLLFYKEIYLLFYKFTEVGKNKKKRKVKVKDGNGSQLMLVQKVEYKKKKIFKD